MFLYCSASSQTDIISWYGTPNFDSFKPVAIFGFTTGDTSGFTRMAIAASLPNSSVTSAKALSSSRESTEIFTPDSTAALKSSSLFELPLNKIFSRGMPANLVRWSSPAENTSAPIPSCASTFKIAKLPFAFTAKNMSVSMSVLGVPKVRL